MHVYRFERSRFFWTVSLLCLLALSAQAQQFDSSPGAAINNTLPPVNDTIIVTGGPASITTIRVELNITHTYDDDLDIFLVSPAGDTIELTTDNGNFGGDNYTGTNFTGSSDAIHTAFSGDITSGSAPFTGFFTPEGLTEFDMLYGTAADGLWILQITDDAGGDNGTLDMWTIEFANAAAPVISSDDPSGTYDTATAINHTFTATNGPSTWSVTSGALPSGWDLDMTTGDLTGTATSTGDFSFEVTADNTSATDSQTVDVTIVLTVFHSENFNTGLGGWTPVDGGTTTDTWFHDPAPGSRGSIDGSGMAMVDSDAVGSGATLVEDLESPMIDASSVTASLFLEFDSYFQNLTSGSDLAQVEVFDGTTWQILETLTDDDPATTSSTSIVAPAIHKSFDITQYANAALQVRFHYDDMGAWAWYWVVDNVVIVEKTPDPIAEWDFEGMVVAATGQHPDITAGDFSLALSTLTFVAGNGSNDGANGNTWNGTPGAQYFSVTLTPDAGKQIELSQVNFDAAASNTGPNTLDIEYYDNGTMISGGSTTGLSINQPSGNWGSTQSGVPTLSQGPFTGPIEIRFIGTGASSSAGTFRMDNLEIFGLVTDSGVAPAIAVSRNGTDLLDNTTIDDVGDVDLAGASFTYDIDNTTGTQDLVIDAVTYSNESNVAGSVVTSLPLTITAGSTGTLELFYDPIAVGAWFLDVDLENNTVGTTDPYTLFIDGNGISGGAPDIAVSRSGSIADGGSDDVGNVDVSGASATYTIDNSAGTADLIIDAVSFSNESNVTASTVTTLPLTVTAGNTGSLEVNFDPDVDGAFSVDMDIENNTSGNDPYDIAVSGTGTGGVPTIEVVLNSSSVSDNDFIDVGNVDVGGQTFTYELTNNGTGDLVVSAVNFVGMDNSSPSVVTSLPLTVGIGNTGNLNINFDPDCNGTFTVDFDIVNNSAANTDLFTIDHDGTGTGGAAALDVTRSSSSIAAGGTDAQGSQAISTPLTLTYTIDNSAGTADLNVTGTTIDVTTETNVSSVSVSSGGGAQTVACGQTATFVVSYTVDTAAAFDFDFVVESDDATNPSYRVTVSGTGSATTTNPEINVVDAGSSPIADGGSDPQGTVNVGVTQSVSYTIQNTGNGDLTVSGVSFANLQNVTTPNLSTAPAGTVAAGGSSSFTVQYAVGAANPYSFDVVIANDDADEGSYTITVSGTGQAVPGQPALSVVGATNFSAPSTTSPITAIWTVSNSGTGTLTISSLTLTGSSTFSLSGLSLPLSLNAGQTQSFSITYTPTATGTVTAVVTVDSNSGGVQTTTTINLTGDIATQIQGSKSSKKSCSVIAGTSDSQGMIGLLFLGALAYLRLRRKQFAVTEA